MRTNCILSLYHLFLYAFCVENMLTCLSLYTRSELSYLLIAKQTKRCRLSLIHIMWIAKYLRLRWRRFSWRIWILLIRNDFRLWCGSRFNRIFLNVLRILLRLFTIFLYNFDFEIVGLIYFEGLTNFLKLFDYFFVINWCI